MFRSSAGEAPGPVPLRTRGLPASGDDGGRRSRLTFWWWAAALVLLFVLGLGVRLVFIGPGEDTPPTAPPPAPPPAAGVPCEGGGGTPPPPSSGTEHEWVRIGKVYAPADPQIGPARTAGVRSCYAAGPAGALFAAANWMAALTDPQLVDPAIRQLTAESAGRDQLISTLETDPVALNASGATPYSFAGYRFLSESDEQVTVSLAFAVPGRGTAAASMTVVWDSQRNDWLVVPPPSGDVGDIVDPSLPSLAGYTPWSAR